MRNRLVRSILAGLLLLGAGVPGWTAGAWQKVKPAGVKSTLPKGKTLSRSVSPDRRYVLLVRDEGEKGDFFWRSVYVQHGNSYTLLTTCNEFRQPRWSRNPAAVRFEIDVATDSTEMERQELVYTPGTKTLRKRTLRKMRVEPAG